MKLKAKDVYIAQCNNARAIKMMFEEKWKDDRYYAEICANSKCLEEFTEENPQVTVDTQLCFNCYQEMGMFP